jgi:hypothetical protein
MSTNEKLILEGFLQLPRKNQVALLKKMLESVDDNNIGVTKSWVKEAERRLAAVAKGEEEPLSGADVLEEIRRRYVRQRGI